MEVDGVGESDCLVESRKESGKTVSADPDRQKESPLNGTWTRDSKFPLQWLADTRAFTIEISVGAFKSQQPRRRSFHAPRTPFDVETLAFFFVCCFPCPASCRNQPFSHHDQSLTPQAANSAVTSQYARYQFCLTQYPLLTAWQAISAWILAMACILLHRIPYPS